LGPLGLAISLGSHLAGRQAGKQFDQPAPISEDEAATEAAAQGMASLGMDLGDTPDESGKSTEGIAEAIKENTNEVKLCEVKYANTYLTVHKDNWSGSLAKAMDFYIEKEEYEQCSKIKNLIDKL